MTRERERELSKRARNEIICSGAPMWSPKIVNFKLKFPLPCGERIKVRGDKYIVDCWLLIVDWKKIGLLLEFTPDLFRGRNDKIK